MGYQQEQIKPYCSKGDKGEQVERMFDQIASTYDALNHRLSWNIDKLWRRTAIRQIARNHPQSILDVATGTGDFALKAAACIRPQRVTGIDISEKMMEIGKMKARRQHLDGIIHFQKDDCLNLSFPTGTFDAVMAAFGIRNFSSLDKGLAEMCRVLKPGGQLTVLELTSPVHFPMKQLFRLYSHTVLPVYGRIISKDDTAYSYLTATIEAFPQGEQMVSILKKAGFSHASFKRLTFGICTMYMAVK